MNFRIILFFIFALNISVSAKAQTASSGFTIIPLGVKGGLDEANLSSYMVAAKGSSNYICLDAGTINAGLQKAVANKLFTAQSAEEVQKNIDELTKLFKNLGIKEDAKKFKRYGSSRNLYNFKIDNVGAY